MVLVKGKAQVFVQLRSIVAKRSMLTLVVAQTPINTGAFLDEYLVTLYCMNSLYMVNKNG